MTLNASAIPIPSEVTLPFAGFLASQGSLSLLAVIITGILGIWSVQSSVIQSVFFWKKIYYSVLLKNTVNLF